MTCIIVVGADPCRAEGGCPFWDECKAFRVDCHSFRSYVADKPKIGIDPAAGKSAPGYKFIGDRGLKRKRLKEYVKSYAKAWREPKKD